jgi:LETM1 and EF-hand domain-containing protein 1
VLFIALLLFSLRQNWLELSLAHGLPSSLLLLSRAFTLTTPTPRVAVGGAGAADELGRVKETLLTLPEEVIKDVGLEVAAPTSGEFCWFDQ